jgi:hypothetical protein
MPMSSILVNLLYANQVEINMSTNQLVEQKVRKLRTWNLVAGLILAVQAIL